MVKEDIQERSKSQGLFVVVLFTVVSHKTLVSSTLCNCLRHSSHISKIASARSENLKVKFLTSSFKIYFQQCVPIDRSGFIKQTRV